MSSAGDDQHLNAGPVGQGDYVVQQGESLASISAKTGHFWETIWNHPPNADLKAARGNPDVLLAGDRLTIPSLRPKKATFSGGQRARFRRKGAPAYFSIQILIENKPVGGERFTVEIDGNRHFSGKTTSDGFAEFRLPADAGEGMLRVREGDDEIAFDLKFGHLDPITEISGVQQRLLNLGYPCGPTDGRLRNVTRRAIRHFQGHNGLEPNGRLDSTTLAQLKTAYGS